jgi:hypothetical protein
VAFRRWRAGDVRSILAAGAGAPQPRPAGDALVIELPKVPVRPLSAYKIEGRHDRGKHARPGRRPGQRPAPTQARHDAAAVPGADGHRQDAAVVAGGVPSHPAGRRDHLP